ncbi:MAG TPA: lipase family protein [Solirubrobacteraceae bacterium]|nr:lipase family protein [Solirubrobacteraceae bacterium]
MLAAPAAAAAAAWRVGPAGLAFYSPPKWLLAGSHGSVIWARTVRSPLSAAGRAYLVLYRSRSVDGNPIEVSGMVEIPKGRAPRRGWPVVSWAHGTIGIADVCAPSRSPSAAINAYAFPEFNSWLRRGYALARTDYEGLGTPGVHPYLVGRSEGRSVIDVVRAARALNPGVGRRWIVAGHSQGGQAALFAAALGPSWAPELSLRGVAAFAPVSHLGTLFRALGVFTAPSPLSGNVAMIIAGAGAVDPAVRPAQLFSPQAAPLIPQIERDCVAALDGPGEFGAIAPAQVVRSGADLEPLERVVDAENPALRIRVPVLILQGLSDTSVPPAFTAQLIPELRALGDAATYLTYPGVDHISLVAKGAATTTQFFAAHLR